MHALLLAINVAALLPTIRCEVAYQVGYHRRPRVTVTAHWNLLALMRRRSPAKAVLPPGPALWFDRRWLPTTDTAPRASVVQQLWRILLRAEHQALIRIWNWRDR